MVYIENKELKTGEVFKDNKNNEYYIIDCDINLNIVRYYKNLTKGMQLTKATRRYKPERMTINNFKNLVEQK